MGCLSLSDLQVTECGSVNFLELLHLLQHSELVFVDDLVRILSIFTLQHVIIAHSNHTSLNVSFSLVSLLVQLGLQLVDLVLSIVALLGHLSDVLLESLELLSVVDDRVLQALASFKGLELNEGILLGDMGSKLGLVLVSSLIENGLFIIKSSTSLTGLVVLKFLSRSDLSLLFLGQLDLVDGLRVFRSHAKAKLTLLLDLANSSLVSHGGSEQVFLGGRGSFSGKSSLGLQDVVAVLLELEVGVSHLSQQLLHLSHGTELGDLVLCAGQELLSHNLNLILLLWSVRVILNSRSISQSVMHSELLLQVSDFPLVLLKQEHRIGQLIHLGLVLNLHHTGGELKG